MSHLWTFEDALRWANEYVDTMIAHGEFTEDRQRFTQGLLAWWKIAQQVEFGARQQSIIQDALREAMWEQVQAELQTMGITFRGADVQ